MGNKPLTWQQVICVLLVFAMLIFAGLGFAVDIPPNVRRVGYAGLTTSVLLFVFLLIWHFKRMSQEDIEPDFLAAWVPKGAILQVGDVHFTLQAAQFGNRLWIEILFQNLRDGPGAGGIRLEPNGFFGPQEVGCEIPGSALVRAFTVVPLGQIDKPSTVKSYITGYGQTSGRTVRFKRYTALTKKTNPGLTTALLFVGHIHFGGGTFHNMTLTPESPRSPDGFVPPLQDWKSEVLWKPSDRRDPVEIARAIQRRELGAAGVASNQTSNAQAIRSQGG